MAEITALTMPKFGLAMVEGKVAAWLKSAGERVAPGEEVAEIETSKITAALESSVAGTLRRQVAQPGETLPVGALIGVLTDPATAEAEVDAFVAAWQERFAEALASSQTAAVAEPARVETPLGTLQYLAAGPDAAAAMILVHGFGGGLDNFLFLQPALAEEWRTIALDLPGHGGSTKTLPGTSPEAMAGAIAALLDALGLDRAHLVGHSLGGAIVTAFAAAHPTRAASLTLISPAGMGEAINADYISGFLAARRPRALAAVLETLFADPSLVSREMVESILRFKRLDGVEAALAAIAAANFAGGRQLFSLRPALAALGLPITIIWGREDRVIPASQAAGLAAAARVHLLDHAGHMAHLEQAAEVARLIGETAR